MFFSHDPTCHIETEFNHTTTRKTSKDIIAGNGRTQSTSRKTSKDIIAGNGRV